MIVNSGAIDPELGGVTSYEKIAKAIGDIKSKNINVSLADINLSGFGFTPDTKNNRIIFGLKGILNVGDDLVQQIIENRPYSSVKDFVYRIKPNKSAMIALIKAGAFDSMIDRKFCMAWYLWETCDKKSTLNLRNMSALINHNLIPQEYELNKKVFEFNRYLKAICKYSTTHYAVDERAINFLTAIGKDSLVEIVENRPTINIKKWEKYYRVYMDDLRDWLSKNQKELLESFNTIIFNEAWNKYALGTISAWEMEVLCFYYHEHELKHVNKGKYGLYDFFNLPEEPIVAKAFPAKNGGEIKLFKLYKICGTCIAKNKTKGLVSLLTDSGVVTVRFRKEYFSLFDKQISQKQPDGTKKVLEKSWFNRGSMIVVQGIRSGDTFIPKKYSTTGGHQLYKISQVYDNGDIGLLTERVKGDAEESE